MSSDYAAWRERLAEANDPAFWPIEEIDRLVRSDQAQFWSDGVSALVTRVVKYPGGAVAIEAMAAAGTSESLWQDIEPGVEKFARAHGLTHELIAGRIGWVRKVPPGWRHYQSMFIKELANGV